MTYAHTIASNKTRKDRISLEARTTKMKFSIKEIIAGSAVNSVVVLAVLCLLCVMYLTQVGNSHNYSYDIHNLQEEQQALEAEFAALEIEAIKLESNLNTVSNTDGNDQYQLPTSIYFDNN